MEVLALGNLVRFPLVLRPCRNVESLRLDNKTSQATNELKRWSAMCEPSYMGCSLSRVGVCLVLGK